VFHGRTQSSSQPLRTQAGASLTAERKMRRLSMDEVEERAFGIFDSPESTDAEQNWLRAERELLHVELP
jgi:hypothetical protein